MGIEVRAPQATTFAQATSAADVLFTKVQQRVLGILFGNPDRSFYANEVIMLAQSGTGAVQRELARLEAAALVTSQKIGRQKHYPANRASPVFEELHGLILKTVGLVDVLRLALEVLARDKLWVVGSEHELESR